MKSTLFAVLIIASTAFAADPPAPTAEQQDMMKKWMEYSTPTDSHKALEAMSGNWTTTGKMWETPKSKATESKGTSTMEMILGGRFLEQKFKGEMMGQTFEGRGFVGFNNIEKRYETTWIDNMATGMMHGTGTFDAKKKTFADSGKASCPMTAEKERTFRSEWKIVNKDTLSFTMWGPDIATKKEFKQMEITYKRAKPAVASAQ